MKMQNIELDNWVYACIARLTDNFDWAEQGMTVETPSQDAPSAAIGGLPAREAAFDIITSALEKRAGLDEALARPGLGALAPRDRAFARLLAMTVLRQLGALDKILDSRLRKPPPETVKTLLRLGLAQILWLGTPPFAAVSTTLALAETRKDGKPFKATHRFITNLRNIAKAQLQSEGS
jgi:hypothetical protein